MVTNKEDKEVIPYIYFIYVHELPEDSSIEREIINRLTAYTTSELIFRKYINFYEPLLSQTTYEIMVFENYTIDKFTSEVLRLFNGYLISKDNIILVFENDIFNNASWCCNGFVEDQLIELDGERYYYNPTPTEDYVISFMGLHYLCNQIKYLIVDTNITRLLSRLYTVYCPILTLLVEQGEVDWFNELPDNIKIELTDEASFAAPLEDLTYDDILLGSHDLLLVLNNCTNILDGNGDGNDE